MSDFDFYAPIILLILTYWGLLYFLVHRFKKSEKPVYKMVGYWLFAVVSTAIIYLSVLFWFLHQMFGEKDETSSAMYYGNPIICGYYDGLMGTDEVTFYDNNTFLINISTVLANGTYEQKGDSIYVKYSRNFDRKVPDVFIVNGSNIVSYRAPFGKIDSTSYLDYGIIDCK